MFVRIGSSIVNVGNVNYFLVAPVSDEYSHLMVSYQNGETGEVFVGTHAEVETIAKRLADSLPYFTDLHDHRTPEEQQDDLPF